MAGYEPRFDIDFSRGLVGEELVGTFLEDLQGSLIEVKTDHRVLETGNVYVEIFQQNVSSEEWVKSGLNVSKSNWYVFAGPSGKGFVAISKDELMKLAIPAPRANQPIKNEHTNASRGALVKISAILEAIFSKEGTK